MCFCLLDWPLHQMLSYLEILKLWNTPPSAIRTRTPDFCYGWIFFVLCRAFLFHFCVCPDVVSISEMTSGDLYSNISFELVSSNRWFTYAKNRLFEKHNAFVETLSLLYQFLPQELVIISVWTLMALGICKKKQTKKKQLTVLPVCLSLIKQDNLCISGNFFIGMRHMVRKHCLDGIP